MKEDRELSTAIQKIVEEMRPIPAQIGVAVINLKSSEPKIAGVNLDEFIYPASVYKMLVAAEVLRRIDMGDLAPEQRIKVAEINVVDTDYSDFPPTDKPLLMPGEETTLEYLLKLVFERSDNTAANVLIDLVDRENVNKNIIVANGWSGSEITRKFLPARNEPPQYQEAGPTRTCARHLAEFLFNVESKTLVNERVSQELQDYLHLFSRRGHTGLYIPEFKDYYTKGGWFETSLYSESIWRGLKSAVQNGRAINRWRAAAGVVTGEHSHYVIGLLSLVKVPWPWNYFPMKKFSKKIYRVMESQRA